MSTKTWERNTTALVAHAHHRRDETLKRVDAALTSLLQAGKTINFTTVATEAGVTKTYLYSHAQIRARIEALRGHGRPSQQRAAPCPTSGKTDASKDLVIAAKDRRIHELEEEVQQLKMERRTLLGQLYERL